MNEFNIYTIDLEYPKLLNALKEKYKQEIEINGVKHLNIQQSNIYAQYSTNHLLVFFRLKWETYDYWVVKELQDNIETILNSIKDCNKVYYFTTNLFVDFQISSFVDNYISSELIDEDLWITTAYKIQSSGFFTTFTSFVHKNYSEIISKAIKSFLDNKFPNLMGKWGLNVDEIKFHLLSEGNFKNLEGYISSELLPFLSEQISNYNIKIVYLLDTFKSILFQMHSSIKNYEYLILNDLERYFYEIRNSLDSKYTLFPNGEYRDLFFAEHSTNLSQERRHYNENLLKRNELHYQNFKSY